VILVDTSVWVDHLKRGDDTLAALLRRGEVLSHPFVIGELACGGLHSRGELLALLEALPAAPTVRHREVLAFLDAHHLAGSGIGWVDVHLVASTVLARAALWTRDATLARVARRLDVAASPR